MGCADNWPIRIPSELATVWAGYTTEQQDLATDLARHVLWTLTGQVFGVCEDTVRPCWSPTQGNTYDGPSGGRVWWGGYAGAVAGRCGCRADCRHVGLDRVTLPGPVVEIVAVTVDGVVVDPDLYRVQSRRWLRRTDGQNWPTHQDLNVPDDAVGAFVVRYRRGIEVPEYGQLAAGRLAVEFVRGMTAGQCSLPGRATSASRQGINVELADVREWFTNGLTGLESVDLWIMAVNPSKSRRPARITSPDAPRLARFS